MELKEFWEWIGWKPNINYNDPETNEEHPPELTLDNLFKYAVPKLINSGLDLDISNSKSGTETVWIVEIYTTENLITITYDKDLAKALYKAIQEALNG